MGNKHLNFPVCLLKSFYSPQITTLQMGSSSQIINSSNLNPLDPEEFRRQGHLMIDFIADYYQNLDKYPVLSQVEPGFLRNSLPASAPYNPEPLETILQDVHKHILPGLTHWVSPNFCAYFPACASTAGFIGEMISTGLNVNGFSWISSPAATELESIVMDWVGEMLKLPNSFLFSGTGGGVIQGTTCEVILCTITVARDQMLAKIGRDKLNKVVVYGSDQTHCAFQKAAQIAGIDLQNIRLIKTKKSASFSLDPDILRSTIKTDLEAGLIPLFLCATVGTTATTAIDPLQPLCQVAKEHGIWVHVDAAYAGSACICPEYQHFIDGVEDANSFSLNAHKWLYTTLDCCCLWLKEPSALVQSLSTNASFLSNKATDSKQVIDYKDWQISLRRKFRSMKLWFVLRSYGVCNMRNFIRTHVRMAKLFERLVIEDGRFEVFTPTIFSLVCFRILSPELGGEKESKHKYENAMNRKLLESINKSGLTYMTHAEVDGFYVIRFVVAATMMEDPQLFMLWKVVKEHTDDLLCSNKE